MKATVGARLLLRAGIESEVVLSIAAAEGWTRDEELLVTSAGAQLPVVVSVDDHGTRLHRVLLPAGEALVDYRATTAAPDRPAPSDDLDIVHYLRPSRYAPSDALAATAAAELGQGTARELVRRVPAWVAAHLSYVPGSSGPTDGAVQTLLSRQGVCRDYAHLTVAFLRALGVPARLVSVYAPGLSPMDFHAVVEAFADGRWEVVDATRLAPRPHLVRIATGRDAADTAFLTTLSGSVALDGVEVVAVADGVFVGDDHSGTVLLP